MGGWRTRMDETVCFWVESVALGRSIESRLKPTAIQTPGIANHAYGTNSLGHKQLKLLGINRHNRSYPPQ
jgi:hypothetical protein